MTDTRQGGSPAALPGEPARRYEARESPLYPMVMILVLAALYGLLFFRQPLYSDALSYYRMSLDLLHGRPTDFYWPLGWPLMLAGVQYILGESQWVAKSFSFALVLLTLWLQLVIVWKALPAGATSLRRRVAYGIVIANSLFLLYHANFTFTNVPVALFGTLLVYALLFGSLTTSTLTAALLSASMTVVRFGSFLLLPSLLVYNRLLRRTQWRLLVLSAVLFLLPVLAAIAYVSTSSGNLVLMNTANSLNLFYGNHRLTPLYETWQWGSHDSPDKDSAIEALVEKHTWRAGIRCGTTARWERKREVRSQQALPGLP